VIAVVALPHMRAAADIAQLGLDSTHLWIVSDKSNPANEPRCK
jgi:hypothetical protein